MVILIDKSLPLTFYRQVLIKLETSKTKLQKLMGRVRPPRASLQSLLGW